MFGRGRTSAVVVVVEDLLLTLLARVLDKARGDAGSEVTKEAKAEARSKTALPSVSRPLLDLAVRARLAPETVAAWR